MPQLQKKPEEKKPTGGDTSPRPKAGSASETPVPTYLPWNGKTVPLSAEDINQLYSTYQIKYSDWLDLRRAHANSTPWPGEDPLALYKKKLEEAVKAMVKHRAEEKSTTTSTNLASKSAISKVISFAWEGVSTLGTRTFDTVNLLFALSGISAIAEGMGTTATKVLLQMGYDPRTADALGNATEFAYGMLFPSATANRVMSQGARKAITEAANLAKAERITKVAGALDEAVGVLGGAGETVEKGTEVVKKTTEALNENLPKLRTPLEEAWEAFSHHFHIRRDQVLEIKRRVPRQEIAQRAHEGRIVELPNTPEQEAMLRQQLNPVIQNLYDEYERLVSNGVREEDFIEFIAKLYPVVDAMPEYFGRMASAGRALGEFRDPTKVTSEQMKRFFDFFSKISDTPINMENWRDWKDVVTDSLGGVLSRENPKALPRFLGAVGDHGFDSETIGTLYKLNLVSGPWTWVANFAGGTWQAATMIPKGVLSAEWGKQLGDPNRSTTLEAVARMGGMLEGVGVFIKDFTGLFGKNPNPRMLEAITGHSTKLEGAMGAKTGSVLMNLARTGGMVLATMDQAIRSVVIHGELAAAGVRDGLRAGVGSLDELTRHVTNFIQNPSPGELRAARALAEEAAATSSLGPIMMKVAQVRSVADETLKVPIGTLAMPFIKSGQSLARTIWNDSPFLGMVSRSANDAIASGDPVRAADALGRMTFAQLLSMWSFGLAATGHVTGDGPVDPRLRAQWEATGWKPRKLYIGGTEFDLSRLSPIGDILAAHANLYSLWRTGDLSEEDLEKGVKGLGWVATSLFSQTNYLDLFGEITQFADPGRSPEGAFERLATIAGNLAVPASGLLRQFEQTDFSEGVLPGVTKGAPMQLPLSEYKSFFEKTAASVGGWGGRYRRNIFGEITRYQLPVQASSTRDEDAEYLQNLGVTGLRAPDNRLFGPPVAGTEFSDQEEFSPAFTLRDDEADAYAEAKGKAFRGIISQLRNDPEFTKLSVTKQRTTVSSLYRNYAERVGVAAVLEKFPHLESDFGEFLTLKGQLVAGEISPEAIQQMKKQRITLGQGAAQQGAYFPAAGGAPQKQESAE